MTTFTTEELHRDTERVLATVKQEGESTITWRNGTAFHIRLLPPEPDVETREIPDFHSRLQSMPRVSRELGAAIDRSLAGE